MQPTNTGSFASATGGMTPELQEAMSRRSGGNPSGPTAQVTNSAPTANPQTQVPSPAPVAPQLTNNAIGAVPGISSSTPGMGNPTSEAKIIIGALKSRLDALSKGGVLQ